MSDRPTILCEQFDAHADELALGRLDEPVRGRLLAHADDCPRCHTLLDNLGTVVDRLLLTAPEIDPPAGFENRALARIGSATEASSHRSARRLWVAGGVAAVGIMVVGAFLVVRSDGGPKVATAVIAGVTGTEVGSVQLIADPTPHVLVVIDTPRPGPGRYDCELQRPDGAWETVGWWDAADIASGVWAVGIDPELLDATAMRVTSDGDVLATADFG